MKKIISSVAVLLFPTTAFAGPSPYSTPSSSPYASSTPSSYSTPSPSPYVSSTPSSYSTPSPSPYVRPTSSSPSSNYYYQPVSYSTTTQYSSPSDLSPSDDAEHEEEGATQNAYVTPVSSPSDLSPSNDAEHEQEDVTHNAFATPTPTPIEFINGFVNGGISEKTRKELLEREWAEEYEIHNPCNVTIEYLDTYYNAKYDNQGYYSDWYDAEDSWASVASLVDHENYYFKEEDVISVRGASVEEFLSRARAVRKEGQVELSFPILDKGKIPFIGKNLDSKTLRRTEIDENQIRVSFDKEACPNERFTQIKVEAIPLKEGKPVNVKGHNNVRLGNVPTSNPSEFSVKAPWYGIHVEGSEVEKKTEGICHDEVAPYGFSFDIKFKNSRNNTKIDLRLDSTLPVGNGFSGNKYYYHHNDSNFKPSFDEGQCCYSLEDNQLPVLHRNAEGNSIESSYRYHVAAEERYHTRQSSLGTNLNFEQHGAEGALVNFKNLRSLMGTTSVCSKKRILEREIEGLNHGACKRAKVSLGRKMVRGTKKLLKALDKLKSRTDVRAHTEYTAKAATGANILWDNVGAYNYGCAYYRKGYQAHGIKPKVPELPDSLK